MEPSHLIQAQTTVVPRRDCMSKVPGSPQKTCEGEELAHHSTAPVKTHTVLSESPREAEQCDALMVGGHPLVKNGNCFPGPTLHRLCPRPPHHTAQMCLPRQHACSLSTGKLLDHFGRDTGQFACSPRTSARVRRSPCCFHRQTVSQSVLAVGLYGSLETSLPMSQRTCLQRCTGVHKKEPELNVKIAVIK